MTEGQGKSSIAPLSGATMKNVLNAFYCFPVLPGAFQSAVHGIITGTNYSAGVQATLRAGGCNASRGGFIGACLGAQVRKTTSNID